jgi:GNAT superfamily N-acetyltransferase
MAARAWRTDGPEHAMEAAGTFLARDPVRHNVILTLLRARIDSPQPGRYWVVDGDDGVEGVVFQSPLHYPASVTPMADDAIVAVVAAVHDEGVRLPGVTGEAATSARFAGAWSERARVGARPDLGQRIYEVDDVTAATAPGHFGRAELQHRDLLVSWFAAFQAEVGEPVSDLTEVVERRLGDRELWTWCDPEPVALAGLVAPVAGVVRVGPVYTPPARRGRGYASALVAQLSRDVLDQGLRCILYTDLANPTSNSIYRTIGYRAVTEVLRYRFDERG